MAEKKNLFQRMFGSNVIQTDIKQAGNMVGYFGVNSHSKEYKYADLANEGYKKNAIVYRCVNEISKGASSVDYLLKSGDDVIEQHPLINLMDRPNPLQSKSEFMNAMFGFLLLSGNAYVLKVGSEIGKPRELHLLRPDRVVIQGGNKSIPQRYDYVINGKVQQSFKVDPNTGFSELKHIKLWNPLDDYYGCSPLAAAAVEVDQHNLASQHNINLLNNGARPSGAVIFKPKDDGGFAINLSESQRQQLLTDLNNRFTGAGNAGRPMLLEGDFDWKEMGLSPKDMDFINLKHMSATDIALCFGVPSQLVGVPDAQTYANVAEARLALYEETIIPHLKLVESDLNEWLVPMFDERLYLEFSTEEIPALAERKRKTYENITQAVNAGIMTRNEAREQIGLSPVDGGDEIYINASLFPLGSESPPEPDKPDNEVDLNEYEDVEEEEIDEEDKYDFWHDEKAIADIDFTPSDGMATEAKRGLKWREEYKRGGTRVGVTRANQLISKQKLSPSTVKRMYSFFSRHEVDKQGQGFKQGQEGYPSAGRIAWALWGGDAGFSWSTKKRNQIENESKAEADALKVGDMVSWDSSGGRARGKIKKIVRSGKLPVPDTNLTLNATEENPACLIEVYRGGEPSEIIVGHRFATLRKI